MRGQGSSSQCSPSGPRNPNGPNILYKCANTRNDPNSPGVACEAEVEAEGWQGRKGMMSEAWSSTCERKRERERDKERTWAKNGERMEASV